MPLRRIIAPMPPVQEQRLLNECRPPNELIHEPNPDIVNGYTIRKWKAVFQNAAAKRHRAPLIPIPDKVAEQAGAKLARAKFRIRNHGAVRVYDQKIADHKRGARIGPKCFQKLLNFVGTPKIVVIGKKHDLTSCGGERPAETAYHPSILRLPDDADALIADVFDDGNGIVGRCIVDDDELISFSQLRQD